MWCREVERHVEVGPMKSTKGLIGLAALIVSVWGIVLVSYAKQTTEDSAKIAKLIPLQQSSCSSSSSSGSQE